LRADAHDAETINTIFRAVHSIKGGACVFGHERLQGFTHQYGTLLDLVHGGTLALTPALLGTIVAAFDMLAGPRRRRAREARKRCCQTPPRIIQGGSSSPSRMMAAGSIARASARRRSSATSSPPTLLSAEDIDNLIFAPGFSTAGTVSKISGCGVGLDVVRKSVQALGGRIAIHSMSAEVRASR
jgi:chemotaxis protein histidine kinase CheA